MADGNPTVFEMVERVEITDRMAEAGAAIFLARDFFDVFVSDELEDLACEVYAAMANARFPGAPRDDPDCREFSEYVAKQFPRWLTEVDADYFNAGTRDASVLARRATKGTAA